ncbi:MAG: response regulator [Alphaproteobacteria bacterium]|nr:response regulator [Alphaproteobacteria bacterium SS10]
MTVLVADDSPTMRALLKSALESFRVKQVLVAHDGDQAFQLFKESWADLAIVDWNMGPTNGIEFVRLLRNSPESPNPYIPVMLVTGHADAERISEARDAGMTEILSKPIAPKTLMQRIELVFSNPRTFIRSSDYFGPDRRRRSGGFKGVDRRTKPGDIDDETR